jgi:DNA end-binding protein Ku
MAKARHHANTNQPTHQAKGQHRSLRPTWEGHLRLSLVTCPVALYSATERSAEVHFNLINPKTNNRIRMQTVDAGTGEVVERSELVKLESTRNIDIEEFVDASTIDRIYWDQPYYLAPAGKTGVEAFAVIQAAMAKQKKVALGRLVLHQRERVCALEPRDGGLLLTTLRSHDEVRSSKEVFDRGLPKPDPRMLDIAEKIIEQLEAEFDPTEFKDRYEDALRELIERKKKGEPVVSTAPPEAEEKVVDLMEALRRSLKGGGGSREKAERFMAAHQKKPKKKSSSRKRAA